jgi:2'-5' RNA ligase
VPNKPDTTALVVLAPDADPLVDRWRQRFDPSQGQGVPAHITLLYPFVAPTAVDAELLRALAALFGATPAFPYSLGRASRRSHLSYLPPVPGAPFAALTNKLVEAWPAFPPYRGKYGPELHPHLSIGYSDDGDAPTLAEHDQLAAALDPHLPLVTRADQVALLIRRDDWWQTGPRFELGST